MQYGKCGRMLGLVAGVAVGIGAAAVCRGQADRVPVVVAQSPPLRIDLGPAPKLVPPTSGLPQVPKIQPSDSTSRPARVNPGDQSTTTPGSNNASGGTEGTSSATATAPHDPPAGQTPQPTTSPPPDWPPEQPSSWPWWLMIVGAAAGVILGWRMRKGKG